MPETNDRVMAMVEQELRANPEISNQDLRAKAERMDGSIAQMSPRQFNATYPLQMKRRMKPKSRRGGRKATKAQGRKTGATKGARRGRKTGNGRKRRGAKSAARGRAAAEAGGATIRQGTRGAGRGSGGAGRGPGRGPSAADGAHGRVRAALLDFARDLANADGAGLVDVIADVDDYVDRVMKAMGGR